MEKFNEYIKTMVEKNENIKNELCGDFNTTAFDDFLTMSGEKYYKNERLLSFFTTIKSGVNDDINKEEVINYLTTIRHGYEKTRLYGNPVNFSTNPIKNIIRIWEFELLADFIKHIEIMLSKI